MRTNFKNPLSLGKIFPSCPVLLTIKKGAASFLINMGNYSLILFDLEITQLVIVPFFIKKI